MNAVGLVITTEPTFEPLTVSEVAQSLRIDLSSEENNLLSMLITAARKRLEQQYAIVFGETVFDQYLDRYPCDYTIRLQRLPVMAVSLFRYLDSDGTLTTLANTEYDTKLYSNPPRIMPAYGVTWPTLRPVAEAIRIRFSAGYQTAAAIPAPLKLALTMLVGHWYENREYTTISDLKIIPQGIDSLLSSYTLQTEGYM